MILRERRLRWIAFVALILLLAACTSSTEPDSASEALPTAPVAPATEGGKLQDPTVGPTDASPAAGRESPSVLLPATPTTGPEQPTVTSAPASPTAALDLQTSEPAANAPDDSTELMRAILQEDLGDISAKITASGNMSFIPVLMELMRFVPQGDPRICIPCSLNTLLEGPDSVDVPPERQNWGWWVDWLGNHPEVQPPAGFAGWKGELYSGIDPNFGLFFL